MKTLVAFALLALAFTTGFTCSKNTPSPEVPADPQEQMAAPEVPPPEATTESGSTTEPGGAGAEAPAPADSGPAPESVPPK